MAHGGWRRGRGSLHSSFSSEMLDDSIVPVLTILGTKDQEVSFHGRIGSLCFEKFAFLSGFAESSLAEVDEVDVGTGIARSRWVLRDGDGNQHKPDETQRAL